MSSKTTKKLNLEGNKTNENNHTAKTDNLVKAVPFYKKPVFIISAILLLTVIVLYPTLWNDFTNWDDPFYVADNTFIKTLSAENIKAIWTYNSKLSTDVANYHPLTIMSLALNYQISGLNPFSYHFVNLLFHLFNTVLVFYWAYLLSKKQTLVATIVALLFAIHPLHVESVAWISERKDVLYVFFLIPSLIAYYQYIQNKKMSHYIACIIFFILSLLCKPSAVMLPLLLLATDYYVQRPLSINLLLEKIPHFALSILIGLITIFVQRDAIDDPNRYTIIQKIMFGSYGFFAYISKMILPINLSTYYHYPILSKDTPLPIIYTIAPLLAIGIIAFTVWYTLKFNRLWAFGIAFYFFNIVLTLQFLTLGSTIISERYTYLSYLGLFFILAMHINDFLNKDSLKKYGNILLAYTTLLAIFCCFTSFKQAQIWKNTETFWSDVIKTYGEVPAVHGAFSSRANFYSEKKQYDKALVDFNKAIELNSNYANSYMNRGNVYRNMGKHPEAIKDFNKALELDSENALTYLNRGNSYFSLGKNDSAIIDYNKSLSIDSITNPKGYGNRASALFQLGKLDLAVKDLNKAIAMDPDYADAYLNRGVVYSVNNKFDLAIQDYTQYIRFEKTNPQAYNWRGIAYKNIQKFDDALANFNTAIQINSNNGEYYLNRSYTYFEKGDKPKAIADAQKAQQLNYVVPPDYLAKLK